MREKEERKDLRNSLNSEESPFLFGFGFGFGLGLRRGVFGGG